MLYKSIVHELLQQHPQVLDQLRGKRKMLRALNDYAAELRRKHNAWMAVLRPTWPPRSETQIASEALEIALWELENILHSEFPSGDSEPLPLEEVMAFIGGRSLLA